MRPRGQLAVAFLLAAAVAAAGVYLERGVGVRAARAPAGGEPATARAFSGVWYCPHGGGRGWSVSLSIANPGETPVEVRVRSYRDGDPSRPQVLTVPPGTSQRVEVPGGTVERSATVEYFGGWVAASWVARAGGGASGAAAEPCLPGAGRTWLLPDGSADQGRDDAIVVTNPFATDAVISITLFLERRQALSPREWSELVLPAQRSAAFRINDWAFGERTVAAVVRASRGRVAAATLGTGSGGVRAAVGVLGAPGSVRLFPGGADGGQSDLVVLGPLEEPTGLSARIFGIDSLEVAAGLEEASVRPRSARSFPVITDGAATIELAVQEVGAFAAVRRSAATGPDEGATAGAASAGTAWVVPSAVSSRVTVPRLLIGNPGPEDATVRLTLIPVDGVVAPEPITMAVPAGRTVSAPRELWESLPTSAVLVEAEAGAVVPLAAAYPGREPGYAVSMGIPLPERLGNP